MALGKTALFYRKNKKSYLKKLAKAADPNNPWSEKSAKRMKKRRENGRARYKAQKNGKNINGKHHQHNAKGDNVFVDAKTNLSKREKSRVKGSKRNKKRFGKPSRKMGRAIKKAMK
jgi:hypothetical protein